MFRPRMPDSAPNPELLRSLGRLVRGLSALFWGLPAALIVCTGTASAGWFRGMWFMPQLAATALLCFGTWQLGAFQKQERPWRHVLDRAQLFALVNFGLSPFLYWWYWVPDQPLFNVAIAILALSAVLFLFTLNLVLHRLGAMLPDEGLRHETRQYTAVNRGLLVAFLLLAVFYLLLRRMAQVYLSRNPDLPDNYAVLLMDLDFHHPWLMWLLFCSLLLLPLSMTMALIWKTKEVILDSVFGAGRSQ
jgi:hypothetical protein